MTWYIYWIRLHDSAADKARAMSGPSGEDTAGMAQMKDIPWKETPTMIDINWVPQIDLTRCTGCGDCFVACPTAALVLGDSTAVLAHPAACDYCGLCEAICPVEAISLPYQVRLGPDSHP